METVDVLFSANLNSIVGPVQTIKRIISNHSFFEQKGYDLTVFTLDNLDGTQKISNVNVQDVAKSSTSFVVRKIKEIARYFAQHSFIYDAVRIKLLLNSPSRLIKSYIAKGREPQIIVFHSLYDCAYYLKTVKKVNAKIVLFIHGDSFKTGMLFEYFPKVKGTFVERKLAKSTNFVLERVDKVVAISKSGAKNFEAEYPILKGRIGLVVNGIDDLSDAQKQYVKERKDVQYAKKYRLISCGSINGRKGQWIVVDAIKRLPKELQNNVEYTVVGEGPQRIALEEDVKRSGLENIHFVGSVPNVEVYKYLAEANIVVLMSNNEGLPLSLIEALRCGIAGISTKVAGIPEVIVDGYNGVLIEPDVDQLYDVLLHLEEYDWVEMGRNSRTLFDDQYTFYRMREDYVKMLLSVAK